MKNLRYVGSSDIRELSAEDLTKLGVEGVDKDAQPLRFERGTSITVDDDVAEVILNRVNDMREATDEELDQEEVDLEAELGFPLYDPKEFTVEEVKAELATSSEERRKYILDQERTGKNRKSVFEAIGAEWDENPPTEAETWDADMDPATTEAMAAAGGQVQATTGDGTGTPPPSGRASTA